MNHQFNIEFLIYYMQIENGTGFVILTISMKSELWRRGASDSWRQNVSLPPEVSPPSCEWQGGTRTRQGTTDPLVWKG